MSQQSAKKQIKWSQDEDALIEPRAGGMKWYDISERILVI